MVSTTRSFSGPKQRDGAALFVACTLTLWASDAGWRWHPTHRRTRTTGQDSGHPRARVKRHRTVGTTTRRRHTWHRRGTAPMGPSASTALRYRHRAWSHRHVGHLMFRTNLSPTRLGNPRNFAWRVHTGDTRDRGGRTTGNNRGRRGATNRNHALHGLLFVAGTRFFLFDDNFHRSPLTGNNCFARFYLTIVAGRVGDIFASRGVVGQTGGASNLSFELHRRIVYRHRSLPIGDHLRRRNTVTGG